MRGFTFVLAALALVLAGCGGTAVSRGTTRSLPTQSDDGCAISIAALTRSVPPTTNGPECTTSTTSATTTTTDTVTSTTATTIEPTTVPSPTTTASVPATRGANHSDGTFRGIEHYALGTSRCAYLDHHLDLKFVLTNGTTWRYHSDYCGTVVADLWTGIGTFTITKDGATLVGSITDRNVRIPSQGEPYTIKITGGTGRLAGTTGSCNLDNHLRQIQFGVQEQYGTFTCDTYS